MKTEVNLAEAYEPQSYTEALSCNQSRCWSKAILIHIDIRYHFIKEKVRNNEISVNTTVQLADIFTKALPRVIFCRLREYMGVISLKDF